MLTVNRADNTSASVTLDTKIYFLHDLCHYFVEQELNYKKGFWGMLALGYGFTELTGKQNTLTEELRFIEKIVGPVQSIVSRHLPVENFENSTAYLNSAITKNIPVKAVVTKIEECLKKWEGLNYGQRLILNYE